MKDMEQQVAYLQGLAEGMKLDKTDEGKIITQILDLLEDMAASVSDLEMNLDDLSDYVDAVDADLADVEDELFGEDDDCECGCGCEDEDEEDDDFISVTCPNCGEEVCFDAEIAEDEDMIDVTCPNCDAIVYSNYEDEDDEEDEEEDKNEDEE